MSRIRITVAAGASAGQQFIFEQDRVTFGRSADNDVVIDLDAVSREHGELVFENGRWRLHNHSANRTTLGKRRVRAKPRPVNGPHSIHVGGLPLMRVEANPTPLPAAGDDHALDEEQSAQQSDAGSRRMGRAKVWVGIAAFWVVLLALVAVLSTLDTGGESDPELQRLTERQIANEIDAPIPPEPENERRMNALLSEARRYFSLLGSDRGALYEAYRHYRRAKAHAPDQQLPQPIDDIRYREVVERLTEAVTSRYQQSFRDFQSGKYLAAERDLRDLTNKLYPDSDCRIFRNAQELLRAARRASQ